jgi:hypothetical protein
MFAKSSEDEYEEKSEGGTRHLFKLALFHFEDVRDAAGELFHFVIHRPQSDSEGVVYEADREVMYEFLARYLAGEYEKKAYSMDRSPAHESLLDLLEIAAARARAGDSSFDVDELDELEFEPADDEGEEETFDEEIPDRDS